jgi:hypothetical protein
MSWSVVTRSGLKRVCMVGRARSAAPGTGSGRNGLTDPALALRVYRQSMSGGEDEKAQLCESPFWPTGWKRRHF